MADNIKFIGNINDINRISRFKNEDTSLLSTTDILQSFDYNKDRIELFVYDVNDNIIDINYNYRNFKNPSNVPLNPDATLPSIEIDPIKDLQDLGYNSGLYRTQYNFFQNKISNPTAELFISEISEDRTEIRIDSTTIPNSDLINFAQNLINELDSSSYQKYYLLNFSSNKQQIIINVGIDNTTSVPSVLFKLYEPLPSSVTLKTSFWVVEEIIEPYSFNLNLDILIASLSAPKLKGPNFDIDIEVKQLLPTKYENYNSLVSSLTGSSYQKVLNYLNDNSYDLNIDYTSFSNFIHFSSAKKRLEIFRDKINLIEVYNSNIDTILISSSSIKNEETASIKLKIDDIISKFDGFEHYLYFESSSYAWPKRNSIQPYTNKFLHKEFYQITPSSVWNFNHNLNETPQIVAIYSGSGEEIVYSSFTSGLNTITINFAATHSGYAVISSYNTELWYGNYTSSAASFDEENLDHLYNAIPTYVKNDPGNYQSYYDFIDMIGHYFDNIWIYIDSINELHNADNNLEKGVSKDIVYDALKSLGVKLYNNKGNNEFSDYIGGLNTGSALFTNDFSVTSSFLNNVPKKDLLAELYKRIYHNIPLLSKTKGTSAGLQNLITTFGVTGSILSPKEFGGNTKSNQLKGYNNNKIKIINNTITGSVLSSFISVQQKPTSSNEFTSTNTHFVDLSFSPQTSLNSRISSSAAITYPTFSLDEYIGDPRLMESSSYTALNTQRKQFISASAAVSGSAKRLDYKGFFELVKYFDNSLFKMLKDFVPARTNTLTGVTIQSPILERNKIQSFKPKFTEETIYDANYNGPTITEDTSYYYNNIESKKAPFYTGEITGSYVNVYHYFEEKNPNPYLFTTGSVNLNTFNHTDFNVMLHNISSSLKSKFRAKIEDIYTNQLLKSGVQYSSSAELQDSYISLIGHRNSRYEGTKLTSLKYNTYSSQSFTYGGDVSFGKTAAIDRFSNYIGLFSQIKESSFLVSPQKNNVAIKYLVDKDGNLTELNERNKHWVDVQSLFKSGENGIVSLFDNQKYSNQKSTNGTKVIYNSGYNYTPMVYNSTNNNLYFKYTPNSANSVKQFKITTVGGYIKGNDSLTYPLNNHNVYGLFGKSIDIPDPLYYGNVNYSNNGTSPVLFSSYSIDTTGPQQFSTAFSIGLNVPNTGDTVTYKYTIKKNNNVLSSQELSYKSQKVTYEYIYNGFNKYIIKSGSYTLPETVTVINGNTGEVKGTTLPAGSTWYKIISYTNASVSIVNGSQVIVGTNPVTYFMSETDYNGLLTTVPLGTLSGSAYTVYDVRSDYNEYTQYTEIAIDTTLANKLNFNLTTDFQSFNANDVVSFELTEGIYNPINYTASIAVGGTLSNQQIVNMKGTYPYISNNTSPFIYGSLYSNTLILNSELSSVKGYQFVPDVKGNESSLFTTYKNIEVIFDPKPGDAVVLYYTANNQQKVFESTIKDVYNDYYGKLNLLLASTLPSNLAIPNYFSNTLDQFIILSRVKDENNIMLLFDKNPGETSLGFIIPENVNPDILNNIDVITKEVKQKLIDLGMFDGGTF